MLGVVFAGDGLIETLDFPDPSPAAGEVVIEVMASGMCGSDLNLYRLPAGAQRHPTLPPGAPPVIAGHEPCGVVVAVGDGVTPQQAGIGDRVMVHHYSGCGVCEHCRSGWQQMCSTRPPKIYGISAHGAHAPLMAVPASTLVPLPAELSFAAGAAISCGVGTAYAALMRAKPSGVDTVAIFGQGPVGLAATQLATAMGARVIALDVVPERLARASEFGAWAMVNPATDDAVQSIKELTDGRGASVALETSAAPSARTQAIAALRPWGSVVLVAGVTRLQVDNVSTITSRQLTIIGSWTFSTAGQMDCTRFVVNHKLDIDSIFTDRWSLDQAKPAYERFAQRTAGKGVFFPNGGARPGPGTDFV